MGKESKKIKIRISIDVELPSLKDLFDEGDESAEPPGDQENPSKPEPGEASKGESKTESAEASSDHLDQETGTIANERDHFENVEGVTDKHPPQEPVVKTKHSDKTVPVKREKKIKAKHVAISLAALGGVGAVAFRFLKKGQKNGVKRYLGKNVNKFLEDHGFKPKRPKRVRFDYVLSLIVGCLIAFVIIEKHHELSGFFSGIFKPDYFKQYGFVVILGLVSGFVFYPYRDKVIEKLKAYRGELYGLASVVGLLLVFGGLPEQIENYNTHIALFIISFYFAQHPIIRYYWRQFLCLVGPPALACFLLFFFIPNPNDNIAGIEFVWIPGRCFQIQNETTLKIDSNFKNETTLKIDSNFKEIRINGFWISKTLISQKNWQKIEDGFYNKEGNKREGHVYAKNDESTKEFFDDLDNFISALNKKNNLFSLPTIIQFESYYDSNSIKKDGRIVQEWCRIDRENKYVSSKEKPESKFKIKNSKYNPIIELLKNEETKNKYFCYRNNDSPNVCNNGCCWKKGEADKGLQNIGFRIVHRSPFYVKEEGVLGSFYFKVAFKIETIIMKWWLKNA